MFITRKYPPSVGGMEKFSFELSRALGRRIPVQVVAWGGSQKALPRFLTHTIRTALDLRRRGRRIGGVHLGDALLAPLGVLLGHFLRVPVTVTAHGLDVTYSFPSYQWLTPRALRRCDAVICNSRSTRDACVRRGVRTDRCSVVRLGVAAKPDLAVPDQAARDLARARAFERFNARSSGPVLLNVGRLVPRKGIAWFVDEVLAELRERIPDLGFWIIGEGPERPRVAALIERHRLEQVRLLGRLSDADLRVAYAAADAFVMPNVATPGDPEGFGLAALDASAAGLWVFASSVDGIPDAVLDETNGTLLPESDRRVWAAALNDALVDPIALRQRGTRGRQNTLANFGWPGVAESYAEIFAALGMLE